MEISSNLRERPCPVCGSSDDSQIAYAASFDEAKLDEFAFASRKLPEFMHLRLLKCPTCRVLYASPALAPEFVAGAYRDASYDSGEEAQYAADTYARQLGWLLDRIDDREVALEVGTGNGAFLLHLLNAGFRNVVGIEPSRSAVATASEAVRDSIQLGMFEAANFEASSISLFNCFQTIEHVGNPRTLCLDAYRLLRPNGALFLVAHDYESWTTRLLGEKSPIFDVEHLQLFSKESLRYLLTSCNYRDVRIGTIWNRYPLAYWIKLLPIPAGVKRSIIPLVNKLLLGRIPLLVNVGNVYAIGFKRGA